MREYVFTGVGRTGWHIDGSFQPAPFAYSLYHMVCVPRKGDTVFAPLNEIVENLPSAKRNEWERLWMMSDRRTGPIHPLIYPHPVTQKKVNFLMGILYCFLYVLSFLTTAVKGLLKPTRNVQ
jgi:alpha-ketoglutarate-dependent taurine dioxygenase